MVEQADKTKTSKSELLKQLKIDRNLTQSPEGFSIANLFGTSIVSLLIGALLSYYLFSNRQLNSMTSFQAANKIPVMQTEQSSDSATNGEAHKQITRQKIVSKTLLNASGYITARRMATVSSQVMGLINTVNVEEGVSVVKGQVLATLDDAIPSVNLNQAIATLAALAAQLQSAEASMFEATIKNTRIKNNQYSSDADESSALTNQKKATALVNQISAEIEVAKINIKRQEELLAQYTIRAPFDGIVTMKNAQPGEIVSPGSAGGGFTRTGICTIVDMDSLEIEVDVNESFIGRVYPNQRVTANLDAYPSWSIPASVIAVIPTADRGKATVSVRIKIELKDQRILPDMGVKVAFLKASEEASL